MKKKLSAKQAEKLVKKIEKKLHKIGEHGAVGFLTQQGRICVECNKPIVEPEPKCRCGLSLSTCEELCIKGVCACSRLGKHSFVEPLQSGSWESEYRELWLTPQGYTVTNVEQLQKIVKSFIKSLLHAQQQEWKEKIKRSQSKYHPQHLGKGGGICRECAIYDDALAILK